MLIDPQATIHLDRVAALNNPPIETLTPEEARQVLQPRADAAVSENPAQEAELRRDGHRAEPTPGDDDRQGEQHDVHDDVGCPVERVEGRQLKAQTDLLFDGDIDRILQLVLGAGRIGSINRHLVSVKLYCAWAVDAGLVDHDTSRVVKLIPRTPQPPRHLTDREEEALIAAVSQHGSLRDRTLLIVALHTGLRAEELCGLKPEHVHLGRRSGHVSIYGKRNKYRSTARRATR